MGQAKRRGTLEQRKALAIALKSSQVDAVSAAKTNTRGRRTVSYSQAQMMGAMLLAAALAADGKQLKGNP